MATSAATREAQEAGTGPRSRTGGQLIVDALIKGGVRHAFGIAGVHNLPVYDALAQSGQIKSYVTRHEQGAAFMADGYARVAGTPGVALVTTGPGLTNTVTPLAGAWSDSVPLLVIGTAGELPLLGKYKGYLHEYKDQHGVMQAAAGSHLVESTAELERVTLEALARMQSGRPRPMTLEVPIDVLAARATVEPAELPALPPPPAPDEAAVGRTAELLLAARYPLRLAGGGVGRAGAHALLLPLAETRRAPVLASIRGQGAIPASSLSAAGCTWRTSSGPTDGYPELWRADAGLVIGSLRGCPLGPGACPCLSPWRTWISTPMRWARATRSGNAWWATRGWGWRCSWRRSTAGAAPGPAAGRGPRSARARRR